MAPESMTQQEQEDQEWVRTVLHERPETVLPRHLETAKNALHVLYLLRVCRSCEQPLVVPDELPPLSYVGTAEVGTQPWSNDAPLHVFSSMIWCATCKREYRTAVTVPFRAADGGDGSNGVDGMSQG